MFYSAQYYNLCFDYHFIVCCSFKWDSVKCSSAKSHKNVSFCLMSFWQLSCWRMSLHWTSFFWVSVFRISLCWVSLCSTLFYCLSLALKFFGSSFILVGLNIFNVEVTKARLHSFRNFGKYYRVNSVNYDEYLEYNCTEVCQWAQYCSIVRQRYEQVSIS